MKRASRRPGFPPAIVAANLTVRIFEPSVRTMSDDWPIPSAPLWSIPKSTRQSWDRKVPYYLRVRDHFASLIGTGVLAPQAKLPSERDVGEVFQITRVTARQALIQLEVEGLVYRLKRRGWFVSPPRVRYDPAGNISFTKNVKAQGRFPGTRVISKERILASAWDHEHLQVTIGAPVFLIRRVRLVDDRAVLVEHLHVNAERCPGLLDHPLEGSLTEILADHYGIILRRAQVSMHPTALNESQAEVLGVAAGTPGLYLARASFDQSNNVIEFDQEFWRHDVLEICVDVPAEQGPRRTPEDAHPSPV